MFLRDNVVALSAVTAPLNSGDLSEFSHIENEDYTEEDFVASRIFLCPIECLYADIRPSKSLGTTDVTAARHLSQVASPGLPRTI